MGTHKLMENEPWLKSYFSEISQIPVLTPDEEQELARQMRTGDDEAFKKLIRSNLRFVVKIAQQYRHRGLPIEDLVNEGNLGLIEAAKRFDETRGFKFISFAVWWIRQAIKKALNEQSHIVRMPLNRLSDFNKATRAFLKLEQEFSRDPTIHEVADHMDTSVEKLSNMLASPTLTFSLESSLPEEDSLNLIETIEDEFEEAPDKEVEFNSLKKKIEEVLSTLTEQQAKIIRLSFGIDEEQPLSSEKIAEILNISNNKVRQIRDKALKRLQHSKRSQHLREIFRN